MIIDLTKKLFSLEGEAFKHEDKDRTLFDWVKGSLNTPKNGQSFTQEESAQKVNIFINLKRCKDFAKFEIESKDICIIKDTLAIYCPPESMAQIYLLLEGKENIFEN